jgi:hypothetical protein
LKKTKRDFQIIFRTFGKDLPDIIWEWNKFCSGEHPCYNGQGEGCAHVKFEGNKGTKDLKISNRHQSALFYRRDGQEISEAQLVTGTLNRQPAPKEEDDSLEDFYRGEIEEGNVEVVRDGVEILRHLYETLKKRNTMAI